MQRGQRQGESYSSLRLAPEQGRLQSYLDSVVRWRAKRSSKGGGAQEARYKGA